MTPGRWVIAGLLVVEAAAAVRAVQFYARGAGKVR